MAGRLHWHPWGFWCFWGGGGVWCLSPRGRAGSKHWKAPRCCKHHVGEKGEGGSSSNSAIKSQEGKRWGCSGCRGHPRSPWEAGKPHGSPATRPDSRQHQPLAKTATGHCRGDATTPQHCSFLFLGSPLSPCPAGPQNHPVHPRQGQEPSQWRRVLGRDPQQQQHPGTPAGPPCLSRSHDSPWAQDGRTWLGLPREGTAPSPQGGSELGLSGWDYYFFLK